MIEKVLKFIMIVIMLLGITLSILNCISAKKQGNDGIATAPADKTQEGESGKPTDSDTKKKGRLNIGVIGHEPVGTVVELPEGGLDCQGAPLNC